MLIVSIESPFEPSDGDVSRYADRYSRAELMRQNLIYARMCLKNSLQRGETPFSAALLYAQVVPLADRDAAEKAALEMHYRCDVVAHYVDLGSSSPSMRRASEHASLISTQQERRSILDAGQRDPRELLAAQDLPTFLRLEELSAEEYRTAQREARLAHNGA